MNNEEALVRAWLEAIKQTADKATILGVECYIVPTSLLNYDAFSSVVASAREAKAKK